MPTDNPHADDIYGIEFVHARPFEVIDADDPDGEVITPASGDTVVDVAAEEDPHPAVAEAEGRVIVTAGFEETSDDRLVIDRDDEVTRVANGRLPNLEFNDVIGEAMILAEPLDGDVDVALEPVESDVGKFLHGIERRLPAVEPPSLPEQVREEAVEGAERALSPAAVTDLRTDEADVRGFDDPEAAGKIEVGHVRLEPAQDGDGVVYAAFIEYHLEFDDAA